MSWFILCNSKKIQQRQDLVRYLEEYCCEVNENFNMEASMMCLQGDFSKFTIIFAFETAGTPWDTTTGVTSHCEPSNFWERISLIRSHCLTPLKILFPPLQFKWASYDKDNRNCPHLSKSKINNYQEGIKSSYYAVRVSLKTDWDFSLENYYSRRKKDITPSRQLYLLNNR